MALSALAMFFDLIPFNLPTAGKTDAANDDEKCDRHTQPSFQLAYCWKG
jgi:hypothetical protein